MGKLSCMLDLWLFEQLTLEERQRLEPMTHKFNFVRGQRVFSQGEPARMVLLMTSGRVKLYRVSEDGKEVILGFLGVHDLLGEETLFREGVRPFSAVALEPTTACGCSKDDFEALAALHPSIAARLTRTLGEKLSQMADQLADIAMYEVRERLIRLLARMARENGEHTRLGLCLDRHITHEDLAALVGASRVLVSNALGGLRESNLLLVDGQRRLVVSPALLEQAGISPEPSLSPTSACACFRKS
jgi:CRP/FNR family transcriptional regulator, cyclic AMP receptor protein